MAAEPEPYKQTRLDRVITGAWSAVDRARAEGLLVLLEPIARMHHQEEGSAGDVGAVTVFAPGSSVAALVPRDRSPIRGG